MPRPRVTALVAVAAVGAAAVGVQAAATAHPTASAAARTTVSMSEFKFSPTNLRARAGRFSVTVKNTGRWQHEFVVIRTPRAANALPMKGQEASEKGAIGEISEQRAGKRASKTFRVRRGRYVFICNMPGHYKRGMYGTLTVS
jgi:uncharacterized cupredoxin-like copper-binding protein